jgi:hypothetical protein
MCIPTDLTRLNPERYSNFQGERRVQIRQRFNDLTCLSIAGKRC